MIPESVFSPQTHDWKLALSESFRCVADLLKYCELDVNRTDSGSEAGFPFRVTKYYASLIQKGDPQDPLLLQVLPDHREHHQIDGYSQDAVGDLKAMAIPGLIHKYQSRVLLTVTGACPIHCRYCFRRHFPYSESKIDIGLNSLVIDYLSQHTEINEVILSGGDPLMLGDQKLTRLISHLNRIPHIRYLRIHSRMLSVLPERVTDSFVNIFQAFRGQVIFVTHINHPNEISPVNQQAFGLLSQQGFKLLNQSVMLKGINNNTDILLELSYKLFDNDIMPYYLHKLDKVQGAAHYDLPPDQACIIYTELLHRLPGYLVPKFVNELSGQLSKTLVQCR